MNSNFTSRLVTACFSLMILASCESHEQKADDAFERVKEEKMEPQPKDSNVTSKEIIQTSKKITTIKKIENLDEWSKFKAETEKKILVNENQIKEIKDTPSLNAKSLRKVTRLEKENNDLRKQMDEYREEAKMTWEKFKAKMDHSVNEIDIELKDLTVNNKK